MDGAPGRLFEMNGRKKKSDLNPRSQNGDVGHLGRLLRRAFFEKPPELVAQQLLGKVLVHVTAAGILAGRIVETEAYLGPHNNPPDPAAHSHRGPTPRNRVLFGPAGYAYVYLIYGRYFCMNFSCETEGLGGGVLLRALEPVMGADTMARNRGLERGCRTGCLPAALADFARRWGLRGRSTMGWICWMPGHRSRYATTGTQSQNCWSRRASGFARRRTGRCGSRCRGTVASPGRRA
jgi:hypothetical protein